MSDRKFIVIDRTKRFESYFSRLREICSAPRELSPRVAHELAFHLSDLLIAFEQFKWLLTQLPAAVAHAETDSTSLYKLSSDLCGTFEEIKMHIPRASRLLDKIGDLCRRLEPLSRATDEEIGDMALADLYEGLAQAWATNFPPDQRPAWCKKYEKKAPIKKVQRRRLVGRKTKKGRRKGSI